MKKLIILLSILILTTCGVKKEKHNKPANLPAPEQKIEEKTPKLHTDVPAHFKTIPGKWMLIYPNRYGYSFYFSKNFKSVVIIYLKSYALVFKGVYTFENKYLKINVYEMKKNAQTNYINLYRNFTKVKSSQFIFNSIIRTAAKTKRKNLILKPVKITIDGNTSDGYFEPIIKLKKI